MNATPRVKPMMSPRLGDCSRTTNPFATRWVRPGAVPYHFSDGTNVAELIARLRANHWRGAIIGPHGSGKSTLVATLIPLIEAAGRHVRAISLHDLQRTLPADFASERIPKTVLVVDGYEQLAWWVRRSLLAECKRAKSGLLLTVHGDRAAGALPVLYRTTPQLKALQFVVEHELPAHGGLIQPADVASAFATHHENVRETLFALYDLFERRRALSRAQP